MAVGKKTQHAAASVRKRKRRSVSVNSRQRKTPSSDVSRALEGYDEHMWQNRLAWLRRPRVHTAAFVGPPQDVLELPENTAERTRQQSALSQMLGWSDERLATFKQLIGAYRHKPSIENYLLIRRAFPEVEIQIGRFSGIEPLFALEKDFEKQGVNPDLVAAALDADEPPVDALSLCLIERLVARGKLPKDGPGHIEKRRNAIRDATVNFLITTMLEGLDWHEEAFRVPASLIVLIREQLCGSNPDLYEAYLSREKRNNAAFVAAQLLQPGEKVSVRRLMQLTGTSRMTAARWLGDPSFRKMLESHRALMQSEEFNQSRESLLKRAKRKDGEGGERRN